MKLLHLADLHGSPDRADELLKSLSVARTAAQGVDLIAIAGDTWDCVIRNTTGSRFPEMVEAIRSLADVAPVVMIYGTPTHDAEGSLDIFTTLQSNFGITILEPSKAYFLEIPPAGKGEVTWAPFDGREMPYAKALIFGVPEPSKKWLAPYFDSKAETEQAVRDGLRGLFSGLGAIRAQYPTLPCVMLYHGQVGGARLQNGDLLDNGSGIRPSVDDLAAVGADYIAMGDIHEPQRVGESIGLPAYYPGSAYPVNFGETHEAGANLVSIIQDTGDVFFGEPRDMGFRHTVTRVPFGHPVNRKITTRYPKPVAEMIPHGAKIWVEITCTKEESVNIDTAAFEAELLSKGAAPGSRVTLNVLPVETVRAGEIAKKTKLRDKVLVWAENSKKTLAESVLTKADHVEAEAAATGAVGRGDRIQITRLILRGAIGLWKKSGLEEVDLNFDDLDPGLVALIGHNGSGKTTLLENCHPWPSLLTRDGVLKDHFRGRDAFRELHWTDEGTGTRYRSRILINAAVASGITEYYLDRDTGAGFEPVPGIDGRKDSYVEAVDRLFGSKDLFLRSAFVTQRQPKGLPDLADATVGQRKDLFSALCGLEYFEVYRTMAKTQGDRLATQATAKQIEIDTLTARLPDREALADEITTAQASIEEAQAKLKDLTEIGKEAGKTVDSLGALVQANRTKADQVAEAAQVASDAEQKATQTEGQVFQLRRTIAGKDEAVATVKEFDELSAALTVENTAYQAHLEAITAEARNIAALRETFDAGQRKIRGEHETKRTEHETKVRAAREVETQAVQAASKATFETITLETKLKGLEKELSKPLADHCPTCEQMLPTDRLEHVQKARAQIQTEIDQVKVSLVSAGKVATDLELKVHATTAERQTLEDQAPKSPNLPAFTPPASTVPAFDESRRRTLKATLEFMDIAGARATIQAADAAAVRIEELTKQLADLAATADRERKREAALRAELRPGLEEELAKAKEAYEQIRAQYREVQGTEARAVAALEQAHKRLSDLAKDLQAVEAIKTALASLQAEATEWQTLEYAFGDKGIPALELDAVAPSIMAIANGLLKDAFGSRYQLEINTTKLSGTGKAQKQIEAFEINVLDSETGESQEIATLSGGEAVWIRRALYDAFALIRARSTNLVFLTAFQDEADGALDPASKLTYLRMLESAHRQAGRRHTIIITHSPELQELIPVRIEVTKLWPRPESQAKAAA